MTPGSSSTAKSVHIINHTHWDREWFLTEEYTTRWIPELIDAIDALHDANPNYRYLFDGQTLAIEDLLRTQPHYEASISRLVGAGALGIGPLYSQPDWRLASGELLMRNLQAGVEDAARHGGRTTVAWLVDTFGHVSQTPQMLASAGVQTAYVWRGVPQLAPLFRWKSPDGTEIAGINLFGGYRNLYGIARTRSLAVRRLQGEHDKLAPFYRGLPIPLFDGYDLETEPEDPVAIYRELGADLDGFDLVESSPEHYAQAVRGQVSAAPHIAGELLSGKYGSTFPGSLSTRTYLKLLHSDVEHLLHRVCEPMAALAAVCGAPYSADRYDAWDRELLRDVVHDCICGVSVDPVHERMERSYRRMLHDMTDDAERSAQWVARCLRDGSYVVSTTPMARSGTVRADGVVYEYASEGFGAVAVTAHAVDADRPAVSVAEVTGPFGRVLLGDDGTIDLGGVVVGPLEIRSDAGDAYSSDPGQLLDTGRTMHCAVESTSEVDCVVLVELSAEWHSGAVTAELRIRLSQSRTVEIDMDIDSRGTGFIAEMVFDPCQHGSIVAGMPFDAVERRPADSDLLGSEIDPELARVLMGQREVGEVTSFPFQDFVASSDGARSVVVHARGLRSYRIAGDRSIAVTLRRSVEWLAKSGVRGRTGDAGPSMYVPGARCERITHHQLGITVLDADPDALEFVAACESFRNPPVVVQVSGGEGTSTRWVPVAAALPMSSLRLCSGEPVGRFYNPTNAPAALNGTSVGPRKITEQRLRLDRPEVAPTRPKVQMHGVGADRGGRSRSAPDGAAVDASRRRAAQLWDDAAAVRDSLDGLAGDSYRLAVHQALIHERESLELELSAEFNQRRLDDPGADVSLPDHEIPTIADLGRALNERRIYRRIYDYVAELLAHQQQR